MNRFLVALNYAAFGYGLGTALTALWKTEGSEALYLLVGLFNLLAALALEDS